MITEGQPLLYLPGFTSDARATADAMTKAKSSAKKHSGAVGKASSPAVNLIPSPAIPRPTVQPGDLSKVQSLFERERKLMDLKEDIKADILRLQADLRSNKAEIVNVREAKVLAIRELPRDARRQAEELYGQQRNQ